MSNGYCKFMVPERPHYIHYFQCSRKATVGEYCKQHAKKVAASKQSEKE